MGKSNVYRTEALVIRVVSIVPAANTNFTVDLPAGAYHISINVKSNVTGGTTSLTAKDFMDAVQAQIGANYVFFTAGLSTAQPSMIFAAGAAGESAQLTRTSTSSQTDIVLSLPHGFRIDVVKGGAVTGELLEIDVCAIRH